jgi:glycosyltransferase involved in cell wall biosynthesis
MKKISIIIPVFNNADTIYLLYCKLLNISNILKKKKINIEIIFVEDGSLDNSFVELVKIKKNNKKIKIIKLAKNYGSQSAILIGLKKAKGNASCVITADLEDNPDLILKMVNKWILGEKFIIYSRYKKEISFSSIYHLLVKKIINQKYPLGGFDIFLLDKKYFKFLNFKEKNPIIALMLISIKKNPIILKYKKNKRLYGKSQWTLRKKIIHVFNSFYYYYLKNIFKVNNKNNLKFTIH